jgi:hypothetical protein
MLYVLQKVRKKWAKSGTKLMTMRSHLVLTVEFFSRMVNEVCKWETKERVELTLKLYRCLNAEYASYHQMRTFSPSSKRLFWGASHEHWRKWASTPMSCMATCRTPTILAGTIIAIITADGLSYLHCIVRWKPHIFSQPPHIFKLSLLLESMFTLLHINQLLQLLMLVQFYQG